jgi:hypothetical protein
VGGKRRAQVDVEAGALEHAKAPTPTPVLEPSTAQHQRRFAHLALLHMARPPRIPVHTSAHSFTPTLVCPHPPQPRLGPNCIHCKLQQRCCQELACAGRARRRLVVRVRLRKLLPPVRKRLIGRLETIETPFFFNSPPHAPSLLPPPTASCACTPRRFRSSECNHCSLPRPLGGMGDVDWEAVDGAWAARARDVGSRGGTGSECLRSLMSRVCSPAL